MLGSRALPVPNAHWRGGFAIDELARTALRFHTPSARRWARDASDIGITITTSWPFFDALVVAGWYRHSPEVGVQQALISAEVLAVTAGVQQLVGLAVSRERPYGRECGGELPANTRDCLVRDRYNSFYSGHSSHSFAAAAVNCMHRAYVPLYGGAADDWACAGTFGIAVTTALLRVATDVHYVSDVAIGALIGTTTGLMLPWALHYRHSPAVKEAALTGAQETGDVQLTVLPSLSPGFSGLYGVLVF
ncbi:MAG: phosphatase PAP2 family protein [Deltaproteobacteria bacterium]